MDEGPLIDGAQMLLGGGETIMVNLPAGATWIEFVPEEPQVIDVIARLPAGAASELRPGMRLDRL